jgi:hypothetical protein
VDNPFERFDIDPLEGLAAITERLRELVEDADEDEREGLRAEWDRLTLHPRTRLEAALDAFPETRVPLASRPTRSPDAQPQPPGAAASIVLTLKDLVLLPSVAAALMFEDDIALDALPPIDRDPLINP